MAICYKQLNNVNGSNVITFNSIKSIKWIYKLEANSSEFENIQASNIIGAYAQIMDVSSQNVTTVNLEAEDITSKTADIGNISILDSTLSTIATDSDLIITANGFGVVNLEQIIVSDSTIDTKNDTIDIINVKIIIKLILYMLKLYYINYILLNNK